LTRLVMKNSYSALWGRPAKVVLVALILGGLGLAIPSYAQETQTYYCSPTETLTIKMVEGSAIQVTLPDGRTVVLPQAESASGNKYSNGFITVWSKGNTALVEEGGNVKWQDCVKI